MKITKITKENERFFLPLFPKTARTPSPDLVRLGALDDEGAVSGVLSARIGEHRIDITSLYVIPERRRQGIARQIIKTLEAVVEGSGVEAIICDYLEDASSSAFFKAVGYDIFPGVKQYYFSVGEFLRSHMSLRHIAGRDHHGISFVADLTSEKRRELENRLRFNAYDPDWSTAGFKEDRYISCMLADNYDRSVTIIWLHSDSEDPLVILRHFRALSEKTGEEYPDDRDVIYRMTFDDERNIKRMAGILGGMRHMHYEGNRVSAIRLLK
ncbi:MAG: GNAT family N-acetyltransferase [Lachnospiraceae bacterium]|nr:GNAT family N-acetyltransferase [Lachnospiraceae bacterium]